MVMVGCFQMRPKKKKKKKKEKLGVEMRTAGESPVEEK